MCVVFKYRNIRLLLIKFTIASNGISLQGSRFIRFLHVMEKGQKLLEGEETHQLFEVSQSERHISSKIEKWQNRKGICSIFFLHSLPFCGEKQS